MRPLQPRHGAQAGKTAPDADLIEANECPIAGVTPPLQEMQSGGDAIEHDEVIRQTGFRYDRQIIVDERLTGIEIISFVQNFDQIGGEDSAGTAVTLACSDSAIHRIVENHARRGDVPEIEFDHRGKARGVAKDIMRVDRFAGLTGLREMTLRLDIAA